MVSLLFLTSNLTYLFSSVHECKNGNEPRRGVYTFFAAGTDGSGLVYLIKLKVKEIGNDGQKIPANISNY